MFLFQLQKKQKATIKNIKTDHLTKERLHSLGLIKDVAISFVKTTPLGSPRIYRCLNTLIAIRNNVAKKIEVKELNGK